MEQLGQYRIEALLGRGGMGEVYRAFDTRLGRSVALKVLPSNLAGDPDYRKRFERECRLLAKLSSPHIVQIYDFGEIDGRLFLAMQLVEGDDLASRIAAGQLGISLALDILRQVGEGLQAAHDTGVLHRDVKPSNVLLSPSSEGGYFAYLTDFGIAKQDDKGSKLTTNSGILIGTPAYMSPERFSGSADSASSDIYALACLLYASLTGTQPFSAGSPMALMHAHLYTPPPRPSDLRPGIPPELDRVVQRGMAKDPSDRYPSAAALIAAMTAALRELPATAGSDDTETQRIFLPWPAEVPRDTNAPVTIDAPSSPGADTSITHLPGRGQRSIERLLSSAGPMKPAEIPLRPGFRYVHEPLSPEHRYIPSLGHDDHSHMLVNRIRRSDGGAILIGGFRGVGKTSLVENVLSRLESNPEDRTYVTLRLSLAKALDGADLLFAIIRRLFEELDEHDILERLPADVRSSILLSYVRTSMLVADKRSDIRERSTAVGVSGALPTLGNVNPKLEKTFKTTLTTATEASFLAYSETDAEHDFLRIVRLLRSAPLIRRGWLRRLRRSVDPPVHVVVALDEVDKLTAADGGQADLGSLLTTLKNVLTSAGMHVIFVAGVDLLDAVAEEGGRGLGLFESVFAWNLYVPCLWDAPAELLANVAPVHSDGGRAYAIDRFLRYRGRGLPRRVLQQLNGLVRLDTDDARIVVDIADREIFALHVALGELLSRFLGPHAGEQFSSLYDDRVRLSAHYAMDWILENPIDVFGAQDIIGGERAISELLRPNPKEIERLLVFLEKNGVLERLSAEDSHRTFISSAPEAGGRRFRLSGVVRGRLSTLYRSDHGRLPGAHAGSSSAAALVADRYRLDSPIGADSLSILYSAVDIPTQQRVAVRIMTAPDGDGTETVLDQYRQRAETVRSLGLPGVAVVRHVTVEGDSLVIVTEWLTGKGLAVGGQPWHPASAVRAVAALLYTVDDLHTNGVSNLNLKPSKIMVLDGTRIMLTDVDIGSIDGLLSITPRYFPPTAGERASDRDADVYACAAILFELIRGRARAKESLPDRIGDRWSISTLATSAALRQVLGRALDTRPDTRFENAKDLAYALLATPEGSENEADPSSDATAAPVGITERIDAPSTTRTSPGQQRE